MTLRIFHHNDFDGFGASWSSRSACPDAVYQAVQYGQEPPVVEDGDCVYVLDFSYSRPILEDWLKRCASLLVIDHHKTAQEDLAGFPNAIFDMNHSGASLSWTYFNPGKPVPKLILYIEDRDLWKKQLPYTNEFHAFLRSHAYKFELWDDIAKRMESDDDWIGAGEILLRDERELVKLICSEARLCSIAGYKAVACNTSCHWSEVGHYLLEMFDTQIAMSYTVKKNNKVTLSFRSGSVDVSEVARTFGGGGHRSAAGAVVTLDVLASLLT